MFFKLTRTSAAIVITIVFWFILVIALAAIGKELGLERWVNETSVQVASTIIAIDFIKPMLRAIWE